MQHKQLALAIVLASITGTAVAQSNVTVYGTMDTGIGRTYKDEASVLSR